MITLDEVTDLIKQEMRGRFPEDTALDASTEMGDLGLSSLQVSEIVFSIEDEYEIEFDPARVADARTLGALVDLGNEALSAKQHA